MKLSHGLRLFSEAAWIALSFLNFARADELSPARTNLPWAFQPIRDPAPPTVTFRRWSNNDLDRFILAKLEAANLSAILRARARA